MTRCWRDVLPVHPAADLFPPMSPVELKALGANIKANGLQVPIVLWSETPDEGRLFLLDGRNRLDAMEAAGVEVCRADKNDRVEVNSRHLFGAGGGYSLIDGSRLDVDPYEFVLSANIHRRHLTAAEKRDIIGKVLKGKPEASNRQVAEQVKASPNTVSAVRRELEATDQIEQLARTTGKDGRARTTTPNRANPILGRGLLP